MRKLQVRTVPAALAGTWEGWTAEVRSDGPTGRLMDAFQALDAVSAESAIATAWAYMKLLDFLAVSVRSWNFVDEQGDPLPCNRNSMMDLPDDLLMELFRAAAGAIGSAPKN